MSIRRHYPSKSTGQDPLCRMVKALAKLMQYASFINLQYDSPAVQFPRSCDILLYKIIAFIPLTLPSSCLDAQADIFTVKRNR